MPYAKPNNDVIQQHKDQTGSACQDRAVVIDKTAEASFSGRLLHVAFGPGDDNGEPFSRRKRFGADKTDGIVASDGRGEGLPARALWPSITFVADACRRNAAGQGYCRGCMGNGKKPSGAGNVPVQLVVIGEEADFPGRGVHQCVGVFSRRQDHAFVSEVNPLTVHLILSAEFLRLPVTKGFYNCEPNDVAVAQTILVAGGEVAINSVMDLDARAAYTNRLSYQQGSVFPDADVAVIVQDLFRPG